MGGFLHQKTFLSEVKSIWTTNKCSLISTMIMLLIDKAGLIMCGTSLTLRQQSTHSSLMVREHFLNSGQNLIFFGPKGDREGSEGGEAQFEGRVVVMQVNGDVGLGDDDDDGGGVGDDSDEGLDSTLACIRQRRHNQILSN